MTNNDSKEFKEQAIQTGHEIIQRYLDELSLSSLLSLPNYEPNTPEELETLNLCKKYTFCRVRNYSVLGALGTGAIGAIHYDKFSRTGRIFNIIVGLAMGGM